MFKKCIAMLGMVIFSSLCSAQVQPYPPTGGTTPIAASSVSCNTSGSTAVPVGCTTLPTGLTIPSHVETGTVTGSSTTNITSTFNNTATDQNIGLAHNISVTDSTAGWNSAVVGVFGFPTYTGTATPNAATHLVGVAGLAGMNSTGVTFPLLEGVEGRSDVAAGNVTSIILGDFFDGAIVTGSTVSNLYGAYSHFNNAGTVTAAYGHYADIESNTGTISNYAGYYQANVSGRGISFGTAYSFLNADPQMPIYSVAPIIDNSVSLVSLTTAQTTTLSTTYTVDIGGTVATQTLAFPASPRDGREVAFIAGGAITTVTMSTTDGSSIVGPITTLPTFGTIRYKFSAAGTFWYPLPGTVNPGTMVAANGIFTALTTGTNADFVCLGSGGVLQVQASSCTISSLRFKEDVNPFTGNALDELLKLDIRSYKMKGENHDPNASQEQIGIIAESVAKVEPKCAIYEDDLKTPKSYRPECITALLVAAAQEHVDDTRHQFELIYCLMAGLALLAVHSGHLHLKVRKLYH